ncbi:formate dehydrogenase [Caulobacter flavus]|uniref:Formate dehydrogenase n=1 Tax=Caulobacter flavus TaxID=1679497 RepID=A0A2N5CP44_9CAUL|nr:FdhF/YdeP family oxidoreductase [Caulobacter flavus]AYV48577.1 formate dehydrogenase [Caulobacter flavus]PLR08706.1 formate dehydrogenase [Caulobacter flavus]
MRDPSKPRRARTKSYDGPAGGYGSLIGLAKVAVAQSVPAIETGRQLLRQNKADGFACVSCAWPKPAKPHPAEFCENGAKATAWDLTSKRCTPDFFARHTVRELLDWSDYDLEQAGRLTHPMRYDAAADRYVPCAWADAFAAIGASLKSLDPTKVTFYASGRASLETSYMWALMARLYGSQNLPDSSNMCHESTSVGLKQSVGSPVGTVLLEDFAAADAIFFFGQNVGSNSPRLLHDLQEAARRGARIVTFNPLKEPGLQRFKNPQSPFQMLTGDQTRISEQYHQLRAGGDLAVLTGLCKWLIEADAQAARDGALPLLDHGFIAEHTQGFEALASFCRDAAWPDIERESGLARSQIETAARTYASAPAAIVVYGMGLTQHVLGVQNVNMVCNLLLLRGNIGRPGTGPCPVRGHSNVQGQRTVGVTEKPELAPLDILKAQYGFEPPRQKGWNTVEACEALLRGEMTGYVGLGGNFLRAVPDSPRIEAAWRRQALTVQIATKLNRSHLICGQIAYLLPCLSRIERDDQATGPQTVSVEDSSSCIHASFGDRTPASPYLLSESAIVAGIAKAALAPNPKVDWDAWLGDYALVRDAIEATYPQWFKGFNARFRQAGGFHRPNKARQRDFTEAPGGKANFIQPSSLSATGFADAQDVFRLMTLRSNDQFNTTVYGFDDRFRGVSGGRDVLFINRKDMMRLGLAEGQRAALQTVAQDGVERRLGGLRITAYDVPSGCLGTYYPECNVLVPLDHHAQGSKTPASKSVPVRIVPDPPSPGAPAS